jgi:EAL domain-containing protein (putative c-di-GMP-specific phosphodiesterase class I)
VAIDDFGTGYSSLGYIKKLNSDKLKVDREFIKDYPAGDDGSIIKAIIKLANELNMKVIVEGVETEVQLEFIRELGSQEYQGYLCSKPVSIDEIKKLLQ